MQLIETGSVLQVVAFATEATAPPFAVFVLAYSFNAAGMAMQVFIIFPRKNDPIVFSSQGAQANGHVVGLSDHPETKMGILHAAYGKYSFSHSRILAPY